MILADKAIMDKKTLPCQDSDVAKELIVAEYNQLRAELLKRMDIRYQMIQFALTALGVFLTIGFTVKNALPIFAYPILALMLSMTYITNAFEADRMKTYIKEEIEPRVPNTEQERAFGWQHYRASRSTKKTTAGNIAAKCIFIVSSFITLGAGLLAMQLYAKDNDLGPNISALHLYNNFLFIACIVTVIECLMLLFGERVLQLLYHKRHN